MNDTFLLRQIGEIEFDGPEGRERINGLLLEGPIEAVRAAWYLFGENVHVVLANEWVPWTGKMPPHGLIEWKLEGGGVFTNPHPDPDWPAMADPCEIVAYRVVRPA